MPGTFEECIEGIKPQGCGRDAVTGQLVIYGSHLDDDAYCGFLAELRRRWEIADRAEAELAKVVEGDGQINSCFGMTERIDTLTRRILGREER